MTTFESHLAKDQTIENKILLFLFNFQVVGGGALDIDVSVLGPAHNVIYSGQRKEYDNVQFNTTVSMHKIR